MNERGEGEEADLVAVTARCLPLGLLAALDVFFVAIGDQAGRVQHDLLFLWCAESEG